MSISPLPIVLTEGERLTAQQSQSSNRTNTWRLVPLPKESLSKQCSSNRTNTWRLVLAFRAETGRARSSNRTNTWRLVPNDEQHRMANGSSNRTNTWRLVLNLQTIYLKDCSSNRTNTWRLVPTLLKRLKSKCFLWFGFAKNGLTQFVMGLGMVVFAQNLHLIECGAALTFADGAGVVNIQQMQSGHKAI